MLKIRYTVAMELKDVEKLAKLSRIEISEDEKESLRASLESILGYVEQIESVSTGEIEMKDEPLRNVMREDVAPYESGIYSEILLKAAPASQDGFVKVKQILGGGTA